MTTNDCKIIDYHTKIKDNQLTCTITLELLGCGHQKRVQMVCDGHSDKTKIADSLMADLLRLTGSDSIDGIEGSLVRFRRDGERLGIGHITNDDWLIVRH